MTAVRPAAPLLPAGLYIVSALLLAWFAGGQMLFGRIDAGLALPWLMPGALMLASMTRGRAGASRWTIAGAALAGLAVVQLGLHYGVGGQVGAAQIVAVAVAGALAFAISIGAVAVLRGRSGLLRWPAMLVLAMLWCVAGQAVIAAAYAPGAGAPSARLAVLTGLPLRWQGGDLATMLASGPADVPALVELRRGFDVELVDSIGQVGRGEALLIAHPRALAPAELVAIDALTAEPNSVVILADALSSWSAPYPLGDPRNPPVTSLLTPLLDHWGIALAAPDAAGAGEVEVLVGPRGRKLRLHSAGRFTRLPAGCASWGDRRVARCPVGKASVWLVGDADLLHESLWQSPLPAAPWLRRSDNIAFLGEALGARSGAVFSPIWVR